MAHSYFRRRDFNGFAWRGLLAGLLAPSVWAQQQIIRSTGEGQEGEIWSTPPKRPPGTGIHRPTANTPPPMGYPPPGMMPPPGVVPQPTILVVGDSISAEYGLPRGSGWVALLSERLRAEQMPWQVINASVSGDTTAGGRSRLPGALQQIRPHIVVLELGGNDALRGLDLEATRQNLSAMIETAQANGARVLLLGMQVPPNYGPQYSQQFQALYAALAKRYRIGFVPFLLQGLTESPDSAQRWFQKDRIHPNEAAQARILQNVWPSLLRLLAPGR